jgi:hypothetical protein
VSGFVQSTKMDDTSAEKAKARRALWILYAAMGIGIGLPIVLFILFHQR